MDKVNLGIIILAPVQLVVSESTNSDSRYQVLINVITGEPIHVSMDNVFRY